MKFDAAPITPGRANTCQNGTEPSAKSTQSVPLSGIPQVSEAAALWGANPNAAHATTAMRTRRFNPGQCVAGSTYGSQPGGSAPAGPPALLVERLVGLGDLVRLGRRALGLAVRLAAVSGAEVEAEAREVEALAPVAVDLLQRGKQRLVLVGLLRHLLGRADLDRSVALQPGGGRNELPDDHVLLQPEQPVDLALDRGVGQHLRRLLEGGGREERLRRERRLRDAEDERLVGRLLLLLLLHTRVLAVEDELVHELARQEVGVAVVLDADLLQHLPDDQLDVLVVDLDALRLVDLLHLADEIELRRGVALEAQKVGRCDRALVESVSRLDVL